MAEKKTFEEKEKELNQKIRKLQAEKKRLQRERSNVERKKRDHAMILVGTTLMTHFDDVIKQHVIEMDDEDIKKWVHGLFRKKQETPETEQEAAYSQHGPY